MMDLAELSQFIETKCDTAIKIAKQEFAGVLEFVEGETVTVSVDFKRNKLITKCQPNHFKFDNYSEDTTDAIQLNLDEYLCLVYGTDPKFQVKLYSHNISYAVKRTGAKKLEISSDGIVKNIIKYYSKEITLSDSEEEEYLEDSEEYLDQITDDFIKNITDPNNQKNIHVDLIQNFNKLMSQHVDQYLHIFDIDEYKNLQDMKPDKVKQKYWEESINLIIEKLRCHTIFKKNQLTIIHNSLAKIIKDPISSIKLNYIYDHDHIPQYASIKDKVSNDEGIAIRIPKELHRIGRTFLEKQPDIAIEKQIKLDVMQHLRNIYYLSMISPISKKTFCFAAGRFLRLIEKTAQKLQLEDNFSMDDEFKDYLKKVYNIKN